MFERYTAGARLAIFFARDEAIQFGSPYIESEHLLLGILRQDPGLCDRALGLTGVFESIQKQLEGRSKPREEAATSVDRPFSKESKNALKYGAEEADRIGEYRIDTTHLLLGLVREEKCFPAELLREHGAELARLRATLLGLDTEEPGA